MPVFKVRCYIAGVWDQVAPVEVDADHEHAAAQSVCGCALIAGNCGERLRAAVWQPGTFIDPAYFSVLPDGGSTHRTHTPTAAAIRSPNPKPVDGKG